MKRKRVFFLCGLIIISLIFVGCNSSDKGTDTDGDGWSDVVEKRPERAYSKKIPMVTDTGTPRMLIR